MESDRLISEGSLDLDGFMDVLYVLMKAAWGPEWGVFSMNKPQLTDGRNVVMPQIVYTIPSIKPGMQGSHQELKPRLRERKMEVSPLTGESGWVEIYGRTLDCRINFIVYGQNNREANLFSKRFRQLIDAFKGYLLEKGVQNIWFIEEDDRNLEENSDEQVSSRMVAYLVRIEELTRKELSFIKSITVTADVIYEQLREENTLPSQLNPSL